jgi:putative copper resistance protein D
VWRDEEANGAWRRLWVLVAAGAATLAVTQTLALVLLAGALDVPSGPPLAHLAETQYFRATLARALAALALVVGALDVRRAPRAGRWWPLLLGGVVALVVSAAWTSHGAARLGDRRVWLALDALHQLAASAWVGGLVHLLAAAFHPRVSPAAATALLRRFSTLALVAVGALVVGGAGLTLGYVDGPGGLIGTAYGLMVLTKLVLFAGLLALAAVSRAAVRRLPAGESPSPLRLRRLVEVELGVGLTVLFAAAALTSLPPAADVVADRATPAEVLTRFTPRWPSLTSPPLEALPPERNAPRTDADRAWSEYNHHVSGLFVLAMGALSLAALAGARWARHWPLLFLGLGGFVLVRSDPEAWPLGPEGFWAGLADPTVFQHRVFVLLVVALGVFEWMVRTGRLRAPRAVLTFPLLCAVGGGLLLTHSHASLNLKAEFLLEITHAPLGVLGLLVGWGRWLEVRLPPPGGRRAGVLSGAAMVATGLLLLLFRES